MGRHAAPTNPEPEIVAGQRVALVVECEDGYDPDRVGVVIDTSTTDESGARLIGVDFPWAEKVVVVPPAALFPVDNADEIELGYPPDSPKMRDAIERFGQRLGVGIVIAGHAEGEAMAAPADVEPHNFQGRTDRPCLVAGCGKPDRNPIHELTPPYRLAYLEDVREGAHIYVGDGPRRWSPATVLHRRESGDHVWLIVMDRDGDQRGISGYMHHTVPVPLENR